MQAVGGVKGGQYWSLDTIYQHVSKAIEFAVNSTAPGNPILTHEELERLKELAPVNPDPDPEATGDDEGFPLKLGLGGGGGGVNFRDLYYVDNDEDGDEENIKDGSGGTVPAQFIYEPAECRRFFTVEMMFRPAKMWEVAREVMFGDGIGECVEGSETGAGSGRKERGPTR